MAGLLETLVRTVRNFPRVRRRDPRRDSGIHFVHPLTLQEARLSVHQALQVSAVWACVNVLAKALATSTDEVIAEDSQGNVSRRRNTRAFGILNRAPNAETTPQAFREGMWLMALTWGNAYAEIQRDAGGRAVALWPIPPDRTSVVRAEDGELAYEVRQNLGQRVLVPKSDMFHLRGPSFDGLEGFNMALVAARMISHAWASQEFGWRFFANGTNLGGILSAEQPVSDKNVDQLEQQILENYRGAKNAHKLLVLSQPWKFQGFSMEPEKAQFVETWRHLVLEACRFYGVPPHMVAELERATFSNIEEQGLDFVRHGLTRWAQYWAQEASWKLLPAASVSMRVRMDLDWLSEGNLGARAEAYGKLIVNGIATVNEIRQRLGYNRMGPEADRLMVQGQMMPLDRVGEDPAPPDPPPNDPPPPDNEPDGVEQRAAAIMAISKRRELARIEAIRDKHWNNRGCFRRDLRAFYDQHEEWLRRKLAADDVLAEVTTPEQRAAIARAWVAVSVRRADKAWDVRANDWEAALFPPERFDLNGGA